MNDINQKLKELGQEPGFREHATKTLKIQFSGEDATFDSISRQAAIDICNDELLHTKDYSPIRTWNIILQLPSAQPEHNPDDERKIADLHKIVNYLLSQPERKKGKWENAGMNTYELSYGTTAYEPVYRCSACGSVTESYLRLDEPIMPEDADFPNFCPNCGADMRGD